MSIENIKIGNCAMIFNGQFIGATADGPELTIDSDSINITCDQAYNQVIIKKVGNITMTIEAKLREIDIGFGLLLDSNGRISMAELGKTLNGPGAELLLIPYNLADSTGYRFPNAAVHKKTRYAFNETEEHSIQLVFEAFPNENGIFMEKFTVEESQRLSLPTLPDINPAQIERALTKYIAEKLSLSVDKDIFRGGLPLGIDGVGVELTEEDLSNSAGLRTINAEVKCRNALRDQVFKMIYALADVFPAYGETVIVNGEEIKLMAIMKKDVRFATEADSGRIKTMGCINLRLKV